MAETGLEPTTSRLWIQYSNHCARRSTTLFLWSIEWSCQATGHLTMPSSFCIRMSTNLKYIQDREVDHLFCLFVCCCCFFFFSILLLTNNIELCYWHSVYIHEITLFYVMGTEWVNQTIMKNDGSVQINTFLTLQLFQDNTGFLVFCFFFIISLPPNHYKITKI